MTTKKAEEDNDILEKEYDRIFGNHLIYYDAVHNWKKIKKFSFIILVISLGLLLFYVSTLPMDDSPGWGVFGLFATYPLEVSISIISLISLFVFMFAYFISTEKVTEITDELSIHREEKLFLESFEVHKNIDSYLDESKQKRRIYFKKLAIEGTEKIVELSEKWTYGNVRLISKLIGNNIDLLKNNLRRLVLANLMQGDDQALKKISQILFDFCKYLHSPTIEELVQLNNLLSQLPYIEYKVFNKKEKISNYLSSKPRVSRLIFSFSIALIIVIIFQLLNQSVGVVGAVGVTSFWGAFAGFDKIFSISPPHNS